MAEAGNWLLVIGYSLFVLIDEIPELADLESGLSYGWEFHITTFQESPKVKIGLQYMQFLRVEYFAYTLELYVTVKLSDCIGAQRNFNLC